MGLFVKACGWKIVSFFARRGSGASWHGSSTLRRGHWPGRSGHGLHGHRSAALLGDHSTQYLEDFNSILPLHVWSVFWGLHPIIPKGKPLALI